jgi:hypothetical protein
MEHIKLLYYLNKSYILFQGLMPYIVSKFDVSGANVNPIKQLGPSVVLLLIVRNEVYELVLQFAHKFWFWIKLDKQYRYLTRKAACIYTVFTMVADCVLCEGQTEAKGANDNVNVLPFTRQVHEIRNVAIYENHPRNKISWRAFISN